MVFGKSKENWTRFFAVFVVVLFLNLPITYALSISDTASSNVGSSTATVSWETDEEASGTVFYGTDATNLDLEVSSSDAVTSHEFDISGLEGGTEYYYSVMSVAGDEEVLDDNSGSYYSFTTDAAEETEDTSESEEADSGEEDTSSEEVDYSASINLQVDEIDELIAGDSITVTGSAAYGTEVRLYVNGGYFAKDVVGTDGLFAISNAPLVAGESNVVSLEASLGDQLEEYSVTVVSDNSHPTLVVDTISSYTSEKSIDISGNVDEASEVLVTVNGEEKISVSLESAGGFSESVSLEEGENSIVVVATDLVGLSSKVEAEVVSDTKEPTVSAEFSKGKEYYQNRAETDIFGETEAGAEVYLYVYRTLTYDQQLTFSESDVFDMVEADSEGKFVFSNVNLKNGGAFSLDDFAVNVVPSGLENEVINGVSSAGSATSFSYYIYIIAVDASGKAGYFKDQVIVNSCYSTDFDFLIADDPNYQLPLKLDPTLLDEGREQVTAIFTMDYQGQGSATSDLSTGSETDAAYQINSVRFEKACTQSMVDDEFGVGCAILPNEPKVASNGAKTSHYLSWNLAPTEDYSDSDESYWNMYSDRMIVFPLQVTVNYQERDANGALGSSKTQTSCYDLSYFVDAPLDIEDLKADKLLQGVIDSTTWTIEKIDKVLPYLEKAVRLTSIGCYLSFGSKVVVRILRFTVSKTEGVAGTIEKLAGGEEDACPVGVLQNQLFLESTIESWDKLIEAGHPEINAPNHKLPEDYQSKILDDYCPNTARLWELESRLEKAYRWTCDRTFCHSSPARWTETKTEDEIQSVILEQKQCGATGACIPLEEVENCQKYVKNNVDGYALSEDISDLEIPGDTCYLVPEEYKQSGTTISATLYRNSKAIDEAKGIYELEVIDKGLTAIGAGTVVDKIQVYQAPGTEGFCGARSETCQQICENPRKPGYTALGHGAGKSGHTGFDPIKTDDAKVATCFNQTGAVTERGHVKGELVDANGQQLSGELFYAGYSSDCFIGDDLEFYQCVCEPKKGSEDKVYTVREAVRKDEESGATEEYHYRQDQVFSESNSKFGTYYSDKRYYKERDFSAAFGQDYALDMLRTAENKKVAMIDPNTQFLSAYQTMCLENIWGQFTMLRGILDGLRTCAVEAKYTEFQDMGMCKQIFSQHVCGLVYKAITFASNQCSPYGFGDFGKEGSLFDGKVADFSSSIEPGLQSTIDDMQDDYGDAVLSQYFGGGAQGIAQSICLAAFGYDFPLGLDAFAEAALTIETKSYPLVYPKERVFSNYDPQGLTAVYNYKVGAVFSAGCPIDNYKTYLKCIGPEDQGNPGVDTSCDGEGCDCLTATGNSQFENEKVYYLDGGSSVSYVNSGELVDIQMQMPQRINSHYRYDHVVLELNVDTTKADIDNCFEEGYKTSTGGKFYYPIKDNSAPGVFECSAGLSTDATYDCDIGTCYTQTDGTFSCPGLSSIFYGEEGLSYFQAPYIQCYDDKTGLWLDCETPNLFLDEDDITVRPSIYTDGAGYCMKMDVNGAGVQADDQILTIPTGAAGLMQPTISLGKVNSEMFGEYSNAIKLDSSRSHEGCEELKDVKVPSTVSRERNIEFDYQLIDDKYELTVPKDVTVLTGGYEPTDDDGGKLTKSGTSTFELSEINAVKFGYDGFEFTNVLGSAGKVGTTECEYETQRAAKSTSRDEANIGVKFSLMHKDQSDGCYNAYQTVANTGLGEVTVSESILVQKNEIDVSTGDSSSIYEYFVAKDYSRVVSEAAQLIEAYPSHLNEAVGIYYYIASLVMQSGDSDIGSSDVKSRVETMLDRFFLREDASGGKLGAFSSSVQEDGEFQKIRAYNCQFAKVIGKSDKYGEGSVNGYHCDESRSYAGSAGSSSSTGVPLTTLCGSAAGTIGLKDTVPSDFSSYSCMLIENADDESTCKSFVDYLADGYQNYETYGCGNGRELCCKS